LPQRRAKAREAETDDDHGRQSERMPEDEFKITALIWLMQFLREDDGSKSE
jgi:hypothetical protein